MTIPLQFASLYNGLTKTILQGTMKGGRQGRQKRWEDNIRECTGLEFAAQEGSEEQKRMEEASCETICGALTTLVVKG